MEFHPSLLNLCLWVFFVILLRHRCLGCADDERTALLEIKASVRSPFDFSFSTWVENKTSDYCAWDRIECSNTTGCVSQLDLSHALFDNVIADYTLLNVSLFLFFKDLQHLDLSVNEISGTKGHQGVEKLAKLKKLQVLDLGGNNFNSDVLEPLSELTSLRTLYLDDNHLGESSSLEISQGVENLAKLKKLQVLYLSGNRFNNSVLEPLSELTSLRTLDLSDNHLGESSSLEISQGFEKLAKLNWLQVLDLGLNYFNANVLEHLSELTSLRTLYLGDNHLGESSSSEISQGFEKLAKLNWLQVLDLGLNYFNANVLEPLSELTSLRTLYLGHNHLGESSSSEISQGIEKSAKLRKLQILNLGQNHFNINILEPLSELTSLRTLYLGGNHLGESSSSEISQGFEKLLKLKRLQFLDLNDNNLNHTSILVLLSKLMSLQNLNLNQNQLRMGSSIEISQGF